MIKENTDKLEDITTGNFPSLADFKWVKQQVMEGQKVPAVHAANKRLKFRIHQISKKKEPNRNTGKRLNRHFAKKKKKVYSNAH